MKSNHRVVLLDWQTDTKIPEKITKTEGRKEITNKQRCEEMGEMR